MKNIAIILAGGVGSRVGSSTPKQFFKVAGKKVVEHSIDAFEVNPGIDEIAIVSHPYYVSQLEELILQNGWRKVKKVLQGGKERRDSSLSAIRAYEGEDVNLIFHDAVRPLVSQRIIGDVVEALRTHRAVDVALPATDTIVEVEGRRISHIPDRSRLMRGQTPQAFDIGVIRRAYDLALQDPALRVTDDCGVVVRYLPEEPVWVVTGEESNMKLTYREDTYLLDRYFQLRRTALGTLPEGREGELSGRVAVVLGGSKGIGAEVTRQLRELAVRVHAFSRSMGGVDVGSLEQVTRALQEVHDACGRVDYVINTAGELHREPLTASAYDHIRSAIDTNYLGTVHVALAAYPLLRQTRGKLVFFTSSSYTRGRAFYSIYSSTKAAVVNFVQAIAQEWAPQGITVNCINPERTRTPMRLANFGLEPPETLLEAESVARATVQSLLTDFTGQVIDVRRPTPS